MRKKLLLILGIVIITLLTLTSCEAADAVFSNVRFVDDTGTVYGIKQIDGKPRVSSMPYLYDIAEGNVANHYTMHKFGYNSAVPATDKWSISS